MRVMRSWRDSLALLAPGSLKPLALVTLKSIVDALKTLLNVWYLVIGTFGVLLLIGLGSIYFLVNVYGLATHLVLVLNRLFFFLVWLWVVSMIILAARASVKQKNSVYFIGYTRYWLMLYTIEVIMLVGIYYIGISEWLFLLMISGITFLNTPIVPLGVLFMLFFFDSEGSIKSLWMSLVRAVKMVIFNLPVLFILCSILYVLLQIQDRVFFIFIEQMRSDSMVTKIVLLLQSCFLLLLQLAAICIWNTIYIKRLHDQPDVYFNQPK